MVGALLVRHLKPRAQQREVELCREVGSKGMAVGMWLGASGIHEKLHRQTLG